MDQTAWLYLVPFVPRGRTASFGLQPTMPEPVLPRSDNGEVYARAHSFSASRTKRGKNINRVLDILENAGVELSTASSLPDDPGANVVAS